MGVGERQPAHLRVWASPPKPRGTGVGVLQAKLYPRLDSLGIRLVQPSTSPNRYLTTVSSSLRVVRPKYEAALVCTTPTPLAVRVPYVLFVYDLRWRRTRTALPRWYRAADLRRAVAGAGHVFAISSRTREELLALLPEAGPRCSVLHLGPGIVAPGDFDEGETGTVLLAGGAPHKRNELVAHALAMGRPPWARHFLGVGLSGDARRTLVGAFGASSCELFDDVDDEHMRTLFRRAQVYLSASTEEGFGLPMVEALAAGCQVVAIRQKLTEEVVGPAAVLLENGDAAHLASQLATPAWVMTQTRRSQAGRFSWDRVAKEVATTLVSLGRG